jgi:hypothetical protein
MTIVHKTTKKELPKVDREFEKVVNEYYNLVRCSQPSEQNLDRMSEIWAKAEKDKKLGGFLERIDFILAEYDGSNPQSKNEQKKDQAKKDEELQYFLSEHIEVLTTQQIKEREWKKNNSNSRNSSTLIMLCPDASGYQKVTFDDGENGETIDQWSKHKCSECDHSYSEHLNIREDRQDKLGVPDEWYPTI